MQQLLKSDIFFVVTTIAVVVVSVAVIIALVYLINILRDARKLSAKAREEGEAIIHDVGIVRKKAKEETLSFMTAIRDRFTPSKSKKKK